MILTLEGQPLQDVITKVHLRANGIQVLQELSQTYHPKNIPEVVALKTSEFWSSTKRKPSETIDVYYNRFQELLEEINASDMPIPTTIAMRHFLFTLGKEFEPIQNNYRIDNLPSAWKTTSWPSFLVLCRDYLIQSILWVQPKRLITFLRPIWIAMLIIKRLSSGS